MYKPMDDKRIAACITDWSCKGWGDRLGEVIRISRAVESAATEPMLARIAALEAELAEASKNNDALLEALKGYVTAISTAGGGDKALFMAAIREADNAARAAIDAMKGME